MKKKYVLVTFLITAFFISPLTTFGEENKPKEVAPEVSAKQSESEIYKDVRNGGATQRGGIKFVGDPDPKKPKPKKPGPKTPGPDPKTPGIKQILPKTGESNNVTMISVGLIFLLSVVMIQLRRIKCDDGC